MMSRLLTRREQVVLVFLAASLLAGSITVIALRRATPNPAALVVQPDAVPAEAGVATPALTVPQPKPPVIELVVSVQGAVTKPGVYRVDDGSRVDDLIRLAGGLMPGADTSSINLAARVVDGTTLTVPTRRKATDSGSVEIVQVSNPDVYGLVGGTTPGKPASAVGSRLIDLNRASQAELETLPGIGPKLAQQIIQYRSAQPFLAVEDLLNVSGIGDAKLASVRDLVTVN